MSAMAIQGGRLELAPPKRGLLFAEPELNGWRALIHTPSGTMWNRHGALLTIAESFRPALAALATLANRGLEGVVMKRADSAYPVQLRSASDEFRGWMKHRFLL